MHQRWALAFYATGVVAGFISLGILVVYAFSQHCAQVPIIGGWYCR